MKGQQGPLGSVPYLEFVLEGGGGVEWERDGGVRCEGEWGVWTEGGTRTDALGDTMKRPQGGKEIRNGRVLAKWEN